MFLNDLRSALGLLSQELECFSCTLLSKLDMSGSYDKNYVKCALNVCGLQTTIRDARTLYMALQECGPIFSFDQNPFLCLERTLLIDSQVAVINQETSNGSNKVDDDMQQT